MAASVRVRGVRAWLLAGGALLASGCALISGLDQYVKGGDDASVDALADQTTSDVASDAPVADANNDVTPSDAGADVTDASVADVVVVDASDASSDCGATNTVANCSMCGAACNGTNASATSCTGATCQYTCKGGFSNCDASAPDLDGCECATPMCCGAGCGVTHNVGVNSLKYYDCVDAGTYDQTQAAKACTVYTNNQFACSLATCTNDAGDLLMCGGPDGGGCACWTYGGQAVGHVHLSGNATCFCADTNDPSWN